MTRLPGRFSGQPESICLVGICLKLLLNCKTDSYLVPVSLLPCNDKTLDFPFFNYCFNLLEI